ncbi:MAG: GntR family transcriptional regulator with LacI sensor, partial [Chthonomonadaceae bacterium]|nr:GntR family transcriptional regulator with LacI sensor [Chthonomonadaceae bacterium]
PRLDSVGLLFFHANDFPQADYIQGIRDGLPDATQLLFCDTGNDPAREAQHLERIGGQVSGILTYPTCAPANTPLYRRLIEAGVPVVCVDRAPADLSADSVVTDNFGSTRSALQSLVARGRKRIVLLAYEEEQLNVSSTRERRQAYAETLHEAGEDPERWVRLFPRALGHDLPRMAEAFKEMLASLLAGSERPDALFCKDDFVLSAALEACDRLCLPVPEEMEILSFSDYPPMNLRHTLAVHRLAQQSRHMGQLAAERLLARCADPALTIESLRVPAAFHPAQLTPNPSQSVPEIAIPIVRSLSAS